MNRGLTQMSAWLLANVVAAVLVVGTGAQGVAADLVTPIIAPAPLASPQPKDDFPNCDFITNDCEVCTVDASGKANCSSQGIACVPTKRWCLIEKKK